MIDLATISRAAAVIGAGMAIPAASLLKAKKIRTFLTPCLGRLHTRPSILYTFDEQSQKVRCTLLYYVVWGCLLRGPHGCANKFQMKQPQDSKLLRGFSLFIGSIALIGLFMGEVIGIPISALFLAYGFGGSKFLEKIGLGHFNEEKITKDKRANPPRESP